MMEITTQDIEKAWGEVVIELMADNIEGSLRIQLFYDLLAVKTEVLKKLGFE